MHTHLRAASHPKKERWYSVQDSHVFNLKKENACPLTLFPYMFPTLTHLKPLLWIRPPIRLPSYFLSFLVPFEGSFTALCKGLVAAAATKQRWLSMCQVPMLDGNKPLSRSIRESVSSTVSLSPSIRYAAAASSKEWVERLDYVSRRLKPPHQSQKTLASKAVGKWSLSVLSDAGGEVRGGRRVILRAVNIPFLVLS